jgi:hypothetical protein
VPRFYKLFFISLKPPISFFLKDRSSVADPWRILGGSMAEAFRFANYWARHCQFSLIVLVTFCFPIYKIQNCDGTQLIPCIQQYVSRRQMAAY